MAGTTAQSTHQTKLAERSGPPVKPGWPDELVAPILPAIGLVAAANYAPIWKAEVATWRERAWVCGVCGKLFLVAR